MPLSKLLAAISATLISLGSLHAQGEEGKEIEVRDLLAMLRAGVASEAVIDLLDRRDAPAVVTQQDLDAVRMAGGDPELVARLAKRLETLREVADLARRFEVREDAGSGLEYFVPRQPDPWSVSVSRAGSAVIVSMRPDPAASHGWFQQPQIVVGMLSNTRFPPPSGDAIAERLGALLRRRFGAADFRPAIASPRPCDLAGGVGRAVRMELKAPATGFPGLVELRTRIAVDGTIFWSAMAAARDTFESRQADFDALSRALARRLRR